MNIGLLYTGGTIGSTQTPLRPLDNASFKQGITDVVLPIIQSQHSNCTFTYIKYNSDGTTLDSTNIQPSDWCQIAQRIVDNYNQCQAFIVLHGTDSMAWTASALSFLLTGLDCEGNPNAILDKPIIVTGSQLPLFEQVSSSDPLTLLYNTDALQNICGAVESCYSGIPESCLYFDGKLFRGNRAVKTNASEFNAFSSPNYPPMGEYGVEFEIYTKRVLPFPVDSTISLSTQSALTKLKAQLSHITTRLTYGADMVKVQSLISYPAPYTNGTGTSLADRGQGMIADQINYLVAEGINGLILESYGEGNFPSGNPNEPSYGGVYQALLAATSQEHPVVLMDCTQVLQGNVNASAYASGAWMAVVGAIDAFDMTSIATLTKLNWLKALSSYTPSGGLSYSWDASTIGDLMQTTLRGEIMDIFFLDSRGDRLLSPGQSISTIDNATTLCFKTNTITLTNDKELGPILTDQTHDKSIPLWSAFTPSEAKTYNMPGILIMQSNGELVFYDSSNNPVYHIGDSSIGNFTPIILRDEITDKTYSNMATKLILEHGANNEPYLYIYDYRNNMTVNIIFGSVAC